MSNISTLTQKGQVAIPKSIRLAFNLKPFDKLHFTIESDKIMARPIHSVSEMRGFVKTSKKLSSAEMKQIIKTRVLAKHENNS